MSIGIPLSWIYDSEMYLAYHSWIYQVHVPGLLPHQNREVWVDALTGEVTRIIDPTRHSTSARVFTPHPNPTGDLSDTTAVELENLTSDNALTGQWANSHNCLTGAADRQVYTCDDLLPIFAGQMGIGGATCADPLIGSFVGEYKHMVLAICGPTHKAHPQGDQGYLHHSPVEPSRAQPPRWRRQRLGPLGSPHGMRPRRNDLGQRHRPRDGRRRRHHLPRAASGQPASPLHRDAQRLLLPRGAPHVTARL